MAEQDPGNETYFPVMVDPMVTEALERMRYYQENVFDRDPAISDDDTREILFELNDLWGHEDEIVMVTGRVTSPVLDIAEYEAGEETGTTIAVMTRDDDRTEFASYNVTDVAFLARGFITESETMYVGGEEIGKRRVLKFQFERTVGMYAPDDPDQNPRIANFPSLALPQEVHVGFNHISDNYARILVSETFPDIYEQAEEIFDSEVLDPCGMLVALGTIALKIPEYTTERDRIVLEQYINSNLGLHREEMPYVIKYKDNAVMFESGEDNEPEAFVPEGSQLLSTTSGVKVRPAIDMTIDDEGLVESKGVPNHLEIRLGVETIAREVEDDMPEFEVRLRDIARLANIRTLFYAGALDKLTNPKEPTE